MISDSNLNVRLIWNQHRYNYAFGINTDLLMLLERQQMSKSSIS
jgi:hypothetical protein